MNPHPPIAMFPPVIAVLLALLEFCSLHAPALMNPKLRLFLSTALGLACLAAYYSGFWGVDFADHVPPSAIRIHQGFARFSALISLPSVLLAALLLAEPDKHWVRNVFFLLLTLQTGLLLLTAHLGGEIVFHWGGGVRNP